MPLILSNDLRERVVKAVLEEGMSRRAAAKRYGIGEATAIRWLSRWHRTGSIAPSRVGPGSGNSPLEEVRTAIIARVEEAPDMTLAEICAWLLETHGVRTTKSSVDRFFKRHAITFKKRQRMPPSKNDQM